MTSRLRRVLVAATVALLAGGALTACNPDEVGAAAVVDGTAISTDELQSATQSYLAAVPGGNTGQVQLRILERMVLSEVIDEAAREQGVAVRAGTVARERDRAFSSVGGGRKGLVRALAQQQSPTFVAPVQIDRFVRDQLLYNKILAKVAPGVDPTSTEASTKASNALVRASRRMNITINPRYGSWSAQRGILPEISGGLSKTAAQLNAK